jgi:hypothetical protein
MLNNEEMKNRVPDHDKQHGNPEEEFRELSQREHQIEEETHKLEHEEKEVRDRLQKLEHEIHEHKPEHELVTITINGTEYKIHRGVYTVQQLKDIAKILAADELNQIVNGNITPLPNNHPIEIKGGEIFVSNVPSGGSSWR